MRKKIIGLAFAAAVSAQASALPKTHPNTTNTSDYIKWRVVDLWIWYNGISIESNTSENISNWLEEISSYNTIHLLKSLINSKDYELAIKIWENFLNNSININNLYKVQILTLLWSANTHIWNYKTAIDIFNEVVKLKPITEIYLLLANLSIINWDFDNAVTYAKIVLEKDPKNKEALNIISVFSDNSIFDRFYIKVRVFLNEVFKVLIIQMLWFKKSFYK